MSDSGRAPVPEPGGSVLLTGATGFVGMEVLARYLERGERDVVCLVRARDDVAANERMDSVLHNLFGRGAERYTGRVRALAGELGDPGLGLSAGARDQLAESVTTIVHSAASVSFAMPLDEARAVNVEGTRRMLEFAELARVSGAGLTRYAQVSTAYGQAPTTAASARATSMSARTSTTSTSSRSSRPSGWCESWARICPG